MNSNLVPAVITGSVAVFAALVALLGQLRVKKLEAQMALQKAEADRRAETEKAARKFSEPLARAAYDLQSRLYNVIKSNFLTAYLKNGDERTHSYAIKNTLFVIAQYFAWTELVRREIQFIDLGADEKTRRLSALQDRIYSIWQTDRYGPLLRIFAGEQRAIGERVIREAARGPECMGYASFLDFYNSCQDPLLRVVEADISTLGANLGEALPRIIALQHALIDLLDFLDRDFVRFPREKRAKLDLVS